MAAAHNNKRKPVIPVPPVSTPNTPSQGNIARMPLGTENTVSMIFGAVVVGIVLLLGVSFWRDWRRSQTADALPTPTATPAPLVEVEELPAPDAVVTEPNEQGEAVPTNLPARYTVKTGDSSWKIAEAFYGSGFNYVDIENENKLMPNQDLVEGMVLTIPQVPVRQAAAARDPKTYQVLPSTAPTQSDSTAPEKGDTTAENAVLEAPTEQL